MSKRFNHNFILQKGNFEYNYWGCTSICWPLSYPFRSLWLTVMNMLILDSPFWVACSSPSPRTSNPSQTGPPSWSSWWWEGLLAWQIIPTCSILSWICWQVLYTLLSWLIGKDEFNYFIVKSFIILCRRRNPNLILIKIVYLLKQGWKQ